MGCLKIANVASTKSTVCHNPIPMNSNLNHCFYFNIHITEFSLKVRQHSHQSQEVMTGHTRIFLQLFVDHLTNFRRYYFRQSWGTQFLHGVVLDWSSGQVRVGLEGKLIDGSDKRWKIFFVIRIWHHLSQLFQFASIYTSAPF